MLKRWQPLFCLILPLALAAAAQEQPPIVVCPRGNPDECYAPDDPRAAALPASLPGHSEGWPIPEPAQPSSGGQALLEWEPGIREPDPQLRQPGTCARTAGRARDRFEQAMQANDLNALVATYQWRGKTEASAESIIERLAQLPIDGTWESSFVSGWTGEEDPDHFPTYWRWGKNGHTQAFSAQQVSGCWFLEFAGTAPEVVALPQVPRLLESLPVEESMSSSELPDEIVF